MGNWPRGSFGRAKTKSDRIQDSSEAKRGSREYKGASQKEQAPWSGNRTAEDKNMTKHPSARKDRGRWSVQENRQRWSMRDGEGWASKGQKEEGLTEREKLGPWKESEEHRGEGEGHGENTRATGSGAYSGEKEGRGKRRRERRERGVQGLD